MTGPLKGRYASGREACALLLGQDPVPAPSTRVFVVTVVTARDEVTRCQFAEGTASDFLAWTSSKGLVASLRVMDVFPHRTEQEINRAVFLVERFVQETIK